MTDNIAFKGTGDASRRAVMGGLVGMGIGVPLLAACGSEEDEGGGGGGGTASSDSSGSSGSSGASGSAGSIGKTSEVPVGGAKIFKAEKVMVSQPTEGDFRAFSTVCTHQQCAITKLAGDEIECGCHQSRFAIKDGSNIAGPNDTPAGSVQDLASLNVEVRGGDLFLS